LQWRWGTASKCLFTIHFPQAPVFLMKNPLSAVGYLFLDDTIQNGAISYDLAIFITSWKPLFMK
jgi:hypothetical protein